MAMLQSLLVPSPPGAEVEGRDTPGVTTRRQPAAGQRCEGVAPAQPRGAASLEGNQRAGVRTLLCLVLECDRGSVSPCLSFPAYRTGTVASLPYLAGLL